MTIAMVYFRPFRHLIKVMSTQKDRKTKNQKGKKTKTKRKFNIVMSGQFRTFVMFSDRQGGI